MKEQDKDGQGLFALYERDADLADRQIFGRQVHRDRRGFLKGAGLGVMAAMVGAPIPFHRNMPAYFIPVALAAQETIEGKDGLTVLNDRPMNAETPPHLLDDPVTPTSRHFIRNNGHLPHNMDAEGWTLTVDGLVETALKLTIDELRQRFPVVTEALTIECGGNGRAFFNPPARGNQWTYGAVGCSEWTGVRLADVLKAAGVKPEAVYTAHEGADIHLSGDPEKQPLSRGVPIEKAMNPHNLIAFAQNGAALHPMHGAPLRLVVPGWPGSCSQKWLTRIWLRDRVHDGAKMTGTSYKVPNRPVSPGEEVEEKDFEIIHAMPVKSLITHPAAGYKSRKRTVQVRGHAWAGDRNVREVHISIDFGATWIKARLDDPVNDYAWVNWRVDIQFGQPGYYEVWARATDDAGVSQPHAIAWNPKGYLNNSMHRIALTIG